MFLIKLVDIPIVVYLSDKSVPISEVNFPAITICPDFLPYLANEFKTKFFHYERHTTKKIYYDAVAYSNETVDEKKIGESYTKILDGIEKGEIDYQKLGLKILKRLQVVDIITNRGVFANLNFSIPNDDFLNIMNEFKKEFLDMEQTLNILWMEDERQYVSEILTTEGLCFTFNNAFANDLLNLNNTSNDFHYQLFHLRSDSKDYVPPPILPRKIASSFPGLRLKFDVLAMFLKEIYEKNPHGLLCFIHDPYELPSMNSKILNADFRQRTHITINAEMNSIEDSVEKDYGPAERKCYLDNEKRLKFFKKYTKANCIQECLTDFIVNSCGCAEFYMIRNSTTRICSASEEKCYLSARDAFLNFQSNCDCLRPCNFVKYHLEIIHKDLQKYKYYSRQKTLELSMNFKRDSTNHFIHSQLYDVMDLLSHLGGFLGLIAGFSFLSFVELIYWFTFRAVVKNCHRSTRVYPFNEHSENQRNFISFDQITKDFLKSSSIHGLRYIAEKNLIDKIFWATFIIGSAIIGTILILKTNEKLPNNQVISYDDSLEYRGNVRLQLIMSNYNVKHVFSFKIIFPAITIIPEVIIKRNYNELFMLFRSKDIEELEMMMQNETFKNDVIRLVID
ncbi:hypothetical protein ACKWTF_011168 [Chironomus riparius]